MKQNAFMKPLLIGLAILFQVGVVASMAISREWILASGTPMMFQTAPIDPRDIFRGDYVRLNYLFSNVPVTMLDEAIKEQGLRKGQKVYLTVGEDINGVAQGERLSLTPPKDRTYIVGRSRYHWPYRRYREQPAERRKKVSLWPVAVKYGIEQYYVEQGRGRLIEKIRGSRNEFQLPMLVHVRLSDSGEAVLQSYEWATIATKTETARSPERDAPDEAASAVMRLTLKNAGKQSITLPLKPGNCSFNLVPVRLPGRNPAPFAGTRSECEEAPIEPVTLAPEQTYSVIFDLNRPQWYVMLNDKPTPMGRLPWGYRYRIRYQGEAIPGVRGEIVSRAFIGRGNID
jgi:uncharacterized membrane-anchored protein